MRIKSAIRNLCHRNRVFARGYDRLTWYKSKLETLVISDEKFAKRSYYRKTGRTLDLESPKTFDEKIWYLKLHNRDPLLTICSDKYRVREYVEQCGLGHILNEQYGVYDDASDIDFSQFQQPVFLKCNHTSGDNIIYDPQKDFDRDDFIKRFNFILKQNSYTKSREWNYKNIPPKIIAERVLRDKNGKLPLDYKFMCFGGEVKMLFLNIGLATETGKHANDAYCNIYDRDFNLLPITDERENYTGNDIVKPDNWEQMIEYAQILSKPFSHCRVDFYNVDGKIYFGEITFYHGGGCNDIQPLEWALRLGSWIDITKIKTEK